MPHQKPMPNPQPTFRNGFNSGSHYPYPPHYNPNFQNDCFRRADEAHQYAQNYYEQESINDRNEDGWRTFRMPQESKQASNADGIKNVKKVGSHESDEELAASALLISAGGPRRLDVEKQKERESHKSSVMGGVESGMHEANQACHVSVNSMDGQENGSLISTSTNIEDTPNWSQKGKANTHTQSFPAILHDVLTGSEFSGSVLEWLPNGKSWRVLRWDDLANKVVPAHFPEINCQYIESKEDDDKKKTTSEKINRFLQHLKAWGFEEMKEVGPEMGAYQHEFFIQIAPNLCRHMKINKTDDALSTNSVESSPPKTNNIISPPRTAPMAPSVVQSSYPDSPINSRPIGHNMVGVVSVSPKKRMSKADTMSQESKPLPLDSNSSRFVSYEEQDGGQPSSQSKQNGPYRPGSPSLPYNGRQIPQGRHPNFVSPSQGRGLLLFDGSHNDMSDNRSVQIPDSPYHSSFQLVPTRVQRRGATTHLQSNRGGGRACRLDRRDEVDKRSIPSPIVEGRRSFPVSNRGKGRRAHHVRTIPSHPIQDPDLTIRNSADSLRNNADIPNITISNLGKVNIEESVIADRDKGAQLKRRRLDNMGPEEAMII